MVPVISRSAWSSNDIGFFGDFFDFLFLAFFGVSSVETCSLTSLTMLFIRVSRLPVRLFVFVDFSDDFLLSRLGVERFATTSEVTLERASFRTDLVRFFGDEGGVVDFSLLIFFTVLVSNASREEL